MRNLTRKQLIHGNWLGKSYMESWSEFLGLRVRQGICRVFGHAKPILKMDAPKGICSRCRVCL